MTRRRPTSTTRSPNEDLFYILSPRQKYTKILERSNIRDEEMNELLPIINNALKAQHCKENVLNLLSKLNDGRFVKEAVSAYLSSMMVNRNVNVNSMACILHVLASLLRHRPRSSYDACSCILGLIYSIIETNNDLKMSDMIVEFQQVQEQCEDVARQIHRRDVMRDTEAEVQKESEMTPPEDYREISVLPNLYEIRTMEIPFLRQNIIYGAYKDVEHYLDVQFRLLREDFVGPLRRGIAQLISLADDRNDRKLQDVRVYRGVHILEAHCTNDGIVHHVEFNVLGMRHVKWNTTRRLIYGSFVCLSSDGFNTAIFGVVSDRSPKLLQKGRVTVRFEQAGQAFLQYDPYATYELVESAAYFEAYRHNLVGLQELDDTTLPLQTYLLNTDVVTQQAPSYLGPATVYDFSVLLESECDVLRDEDPDDLYGGQLNMLRRMRINNMYTGVPVLDHKAWPTADNLNMDQSQFNALQTAMTREFAVIQGPPGTGKTFIGLKIVQLLLSNKRVWKSRIADQEITSPLLIVCYTNHALDQFLEGILATNRGIDMIRVGSRSSSENQQLNDCKLTEKRKQFKRDMTNEDISNALHQINAVMDTYAYQIECESKSIELLREGIIHEQYMQRVMEPYLFGSLMSRHVGDGSNQILFWLQDTNFGANVAENTEDDNEDDDEPMMDEEDIVGQSRKIDEEEPMAMHWKEQLDKMETVPELALSKSQIRNFESQKHSMNGGWQVIGNRKLLRKKLKKALDQKDVMTENEIQQVFDVWQLSQRDRWKLYRVWAARYCNGKQQRIQVLYDLYNGLAGQAQEYRDELDYHVLRTADVIGMTTTAAAKYRHILQRLQSKIVIVEEAAEVLESHIVTTLSSECQHLILIGDHQQLRPNPTSYHLAKKFHLDISLFERMVKNEIHCEKLTTQHRMRPEIAQLLVPHIYKHLKNHTSVSLYPNIKGIAGNMFFINHTEMESEIDDSRSHSNEHEAQYCGALIRYLIQQGYSGSQITILTTYTGQMFRIKTVLKDNQIEGVRVTPVDNFQGEENDIIILSMVRSNDEGKIGFLSTENRICVALSRAKWGFYAIGNLEQLSKASILWSNLATALRKEHKVVDGLPLSCQIHSNNKLNAMTAKDFDQVPDGGCNIPCEYRLNCGHACSKKCHPDDPQHDSYRCEKPCLKSLCDLSHMCPKLCYQECGRCRVPVPKLIPGCCHIQDIQCSTEPSEADCHYITTEDLECGHTVQVECHEDLTKFKCLETLERALPCGHIAEMLCFENIANFICKTEVTYICPRDHVASVNCNDKKTDVKCKTGIEKICRFNENHKVTTPCFKFDNIFVCPMICGDILPCGHKCSGQCGVCKAENKHLPCQQKCTLKLPCGHNCIGKCGESCLPCREPCPTRCSHNRMCEGLCGDICVSCDLPCKNECRHHRCTRSCGEPCNRGKCNQPCDQFLFCRHPCCGLCGEPCPPCRRCYDPLYREMERSLEIRLTDDMRFVWLQPCGHVIQADYMDILMDIPLEHHPRPMAKYECPICKGMITFCPRYGQQLQAAHIEHQEAKELLLYVNKSKMDIQFAVERCGIPKAQELYTALISAECTEPDSFTKLAIGCMGILAQLQRLKIKADAIIRNNSSDKNNAGSFQSNVKSVKLLETTITEYNSIISAALDCRDEDMLDQLSITMKFTYMKTHMQVMLMFIYNGFKRRVLTERIALMDMAALDMVEGNEAILQSVNEALKANFHEKQRNDVFDFMVQLKQLFEPKVRKVKSEFWMKCSQPGMLKL